MTNRLTQLIERAKQATATPAQLLEHEIGFAYGNVSYENPRVTREMVAKAIIVPPPKQS